jgi:hypothetical protein
MNPVFVLSLPRSRTAWLANFLTYGPCIALHEPLADCSSLDDLDQRMRDTGAPVVVVCDTSLTMLSQQLVNRYPNARYVMILRDADAVRESIELAGLPVEGFENLVRAFGRAMEVVLSTTHNAVMPVEAMDLEDELPTLWHFVMQGRCEFPIHRYRMLRDMRVEVIIERVHERMQRNERGIQKLVRTFEV